MMRRYLSYIKRHLFPQQQAPVPKLSIIVVVYKMAEQANNTLYSLSRKYQMDIKKEDYEVIVVENASSEELGEQRALSHGKNFRYFYRNDDSVSPVPAINYAAEQAIGEHICVMIDGARMVTPGMIKQTLSATRLSEMAVISVPGYHLGHKVQQEAMEEGYDTHMEAELLSSVGWKENGYNLFEIACFSSTSKRGYFLSGGESNCITVSKKLWNELGGYDAGFTSVGGGLSNLDFYKRACEHPETELINLAAEGSFHQFHGGVTTGQEAEKRLAALDTHFAEYESLRGKAFRPPKVPALVFGSFSAQSLIFAPVSVETYWEIKKYNYDKQESE